jgi:hypothetical protein
VESGDLDPPGVVKWAVIEAAASARTFTIRRKLIMEIADLGLPRQAPPCDIGTQRIHQRRLGIDRFN